MVLDEKTGGPLVFLVWRRRSDFLRREMQDDWAPRPDVPLELPDLAGVIFFVREVSVETVKRSAKMIKFKLAESAKDARKWFVRLRKDEDGATLIEYSILIGLLTVAVIALVLAVGGWISDKWTTLNSNLT